MSGEILRAEKDYSKEVDKLLPDAEKTAKVPIMHIIPGTA
jgi:hypothetical protein